MLLQGHRESKREERAKESYWDWQVSVSIHCTFFLRFCIVNSSEDVSPLPPTSLSLPHLAEPHVLLIVSSRHAYTHKHEVHKLTFSKHGTVVHRQFNQKVVCRTPCHNLKLLDNVLPYRNKTKYKMSRWCENWSPFLFAGTPNTALHVLVLYPINWQT